MAFSEVGGFDCTGLLKSTFLQCLLKRVVQETRAVILLPTRELASQVFDVFKHLCKGTELSSVLLSGSVSIFNQEQQQLFSHR